MPPQPDAAERVAARRRRNSRAPDRRSAPTRERLRRSMRLRLVAHARRVEIDQRQRVACTSAARNAPPGRASDAAFRATASASCPGSTSVCAKPAEAIQPARRPRHVQRVAAAVQLEQRRVARRPAQKLPAIAVRRRSSSAESQPPPSSRSRCLRGSRSCPPRRKTSKRISRPPSARVSSRVTTNSVIGICACVMYPDRQPHQRRRAVAVGDRQRHIAESHRKPRRDLRRTQRSRHQRPVADLPQPTP